MNPCTGAQLTFIMNVRKEIGLKPLNSYDVKCLNINSASVMIEDLRVMRDTLNAMKMGASV